MKKMALLTVGARGVALLTGRIEDQVGGPTPQLMELSDMLDRIRG